MRDELFMRDSRVPMTKSEVRAVSLSKLELAKKSVLFDIGAGSGSVSIEAALVWGCKNVYAIEQKAEAISLIEVNKSRFAAKDLEVVFGKAPEAMHGLPIPTHAFIGGTSGNMTQILERLRQLNPEIRIVINVITLETLAQVVDYSKSCGLEAEIISVQIARGNQVAGYHMMLGQNPVYVISFGGVSG